MVVVVVLVLVVAVGWWSWRRGGSPSFRLGIGRWIAHNSFGMWQEHWRRRRHANACCIQDVSCLGRTQTPFLVKNIIHPLGDVTTILI
jgi:hypothetical protein